MPSLPFTIHKGYVPGAVGRVTWLLATYYRDPPFRFDLAFEAKVGRDLTHFCENYVEGRDGLWLAMVDGQAEAAIAIDGSHADQDGAHLRWFIASDRLRGSGVGNALLTEAMSFVRGCGYRSVYLWTIEGLEAARVLYERFGFTKVEDVVATQWGKPVNEQRFAWRADSEWWAGTE